MTARIEYTFTVLRYVHDVRTGEFVNVGVAVHSGQAGQFLSRVRESSKRASQTFAGLNGKHFRSSIGYIQRSLAKLSFDFETLPSERPNALSIASRVLLRDDSSLQWSDLGSGVTSDLAKTVAHLFDRLVIRYEAKNKKERRDDAEVWIPFCKALERRQLTKHLEEVEISSDADSTTFRHAWKNGRWHCLEPISLDLLDGESIKNKARRIVGQMTALRTAEPFKLYLLVGEPQHAKVRTFYNDAMKILSTVPVDKEIFTEQQADDFSQQMASEIAQHSEDGDHIWVHPK